jgi:hypothetical protein
MYDSVPVCVQAGGRGRVGMVDLTMVNEEESFAAVDLDAPSEDADGEGLGLIALSLPKEPTPDLDPDGVILTLVRVLPKGPNADPANPSQLVRTRSQS